MRIQPARLTQEIVKVTKEPAFTGKRRFDARSEQCTKTCTSANGPVCVVNVQQSIHNLPGVEPAWSLQIIRKALDGPKKSCPLNVAILTWLEPRGEDAHLQEPSPVCYRCHQSFQGTSQCDRGGTRCKSPYQID
ncbi:hypothetical protein D9M72_532680 [compost metagenome]